MKITKQLVKRFQSPEIEVKVRNGYFKSAEAVVKYSNGHEYKVIVEHTPKKLSHFGNFNSEAFMYPEGRSAWVVYHVPKELKFVSDNLKRIVEYTDEEIEHYLKVMNNAVDSFHKDFCSSSAW